MSRPLQVLIAEDNLQDAELVLRELRRAGFDPVWDRVDSEAEFLAHLHPDLDLILSDFQMPQFTGFRALELLKASGLEIPFILISGTIGEDIAVEAMKHGAADYLLKDRLARLGPAVSQELVRARQRRDSRTEHEALRLREQALAEVSQGVLICDDASLIIYANPSFTEITGYGQNELQGRTCSLLQGAGSDPATIDRIRQAVRAGRAFDGEILNYRKNGEPFWNELSITPWRDEKDGPLRFVGVLRDISERKSREDKALLDQSRYRLLVEATAAIVWETPASGWFETEQPGWTAFTGQTFAELRGDGWLQAVHPDDRTETLRVWTAALAARTVYAVEHRLRTRDQSFREMQALAIPVFGEDGITRQWMGVHIDITDKRSRERGLAQALEHEKVLTEKARAGERAKSQFLAVMSHEIRTPLHGILGFAELLAVTPGLPVESREHVKTITNSGEALLRILDDVLDFSRLEAGGLQIEASLLAPREIVRDIHTLLSPQAAEEGLKFFLDFDPATPAHLWNDAGRLRQALLNLVGNALKFTTRGSVTLGTRLTPLPTSSGQAVVEFFVRDTGPGIPPEDFDHILQPFAQANSSISRRFGGTGLGLSITRHLMHLMGGTLSLKSTVKEGSEFVITLPANPPDGPPPESAASGEILDKNFASNHPLRILLVEDDPANLRLMHLVLRTLGYDASLARDGLEALEVYRREKPDCILMDLQMPRKDGLQATREIRLLEQETPAEKPCFITALTANILAENSRNCETAGMDCYLNKPIKRAVLARTLRNASDARRAAASWGEHPMAGMARPGV